MRKNRPRKFYSIFIYSFDKRANRCTNNQTLKYKERLLSLFCFVDNALRRAPGNDVENSEARRTAFTEMLNYTV